ncbi:MAG: putative helicase [Pirellulaceae bacterium]|jgi:predicted helicase
MTLTNNHLLKLATSVADIAAIMVHKLSQNPPSSQQVASWQCSLERYGFPTSDRRDSDFIAAVCETQTAAAMCNVIFELDADPLGASPATINRIKAVIEQPNFERLELQNSFFDLMELFLAAFASTERKQRGVFYTPRAVSSFLLNSIEKELGNTFGLPGGLANASNDTQLTVVDPACGHGVFLLDLLLRGKVNGDTRSVQGYEIRPATTAIGNYLLRHVAGTNQNLVRCLNPLEDEQQELIRDNGILTIVGNPPYSNFGQLNRTPWILEQLQRYKTGLSEKKLNLNDDFIKFFCWGQHHIERAGRGVLAFITGNTFFQGITHRRMRESLLDTFDSMYFIDLHGSATKRETTPNGDRDENIFAIKQGVGISVFVRSGTTTKVFFGELFGSRKSKLDTLVDSNVQTLSTMQTYPHAPAFHIINKPAALTQSSGISLPNVFREYVSGVQTKRDSLFTDMSREILGDRMKKLLLDPESQRATIPEWIIERAGQVRYSDKNIRPYMLAPFDVRWVYYDQHLLGRARWSVMQHMLRPNYGFVFMRQSTNAGQYDHFLATANLISDRVFYSAHGAPYFAPMFIYRDEPADAATDNCSDNFSDNFSDEFLRRIENATGLSYASCQEQVSVDEVTAEQLGGFVYGQFYSPDFRARNSESLKCEFPRVELPDSSESFRRISKLGLKLLRLHTEQLSPSGPSRLNTAAKTVVTRRDSGWQSTDEDGRIGISATHFVSHVSSADWQFRIGGYQVLQRWLKQRLQMVLEPQDLKYFEDLVNVVYQTRHIMQAIDSTCLAADSTCHAAD